KVLRLLSDFPWQGDGRSRDETRALARRLPMSTYAESNEVSEVNVVCGWCSRSVRESAEPNAPTSHGMSPECAARFEAAMHDAGKVEGLPNPKNDNLQYVVNLTSKDGKATVAVYGATFASHVLPPVSPAAEDVRHRILAGAEALYRQRPARLDNSCAAPPVPQ